MVDYNRYQRARLVGARALQLQLGAPALVKNPSASTTAIEIAKLELDYGVLPITVKEK